MTVRLVLVDGGGADPGPPFPKRRPTIQLRTDEPPNTRVVEIQRSPSAEDDKHDFFNDLAPVLRYHHMTPDFLACVVCSCEWMGDSGLLVTVLSSALVQRDALSGFLRAGNIARGASDRGVDPTDAI